MYSAIILTIGVYSMMVLFFMLTFAIKVLFKLIDFILFTAQYLCVLLNNTSSL